MTCRASFPNTGPAENLDSRPALASAGGLVCGFATSVIRTPLISAHRRGRSSMSETTCHMSISLDGFVAGPDQSLEHPLGRRGIELHHWHLDEPLHDADARARDLLLRPRGAYVLGRNMFGPIRGPWQ